ncbi:parasitic phase-specific protein psp-1 [Apiospora kogelbergensis]|uniref:parasitic phase-specific protein psp-1 n=1 Tax=Apiospora kogelbergensis TaxID=1337665 RepID=UPI0031304AB1
MGSATHPLMTLNSTILIPLHPSTHLDPAQLRYMIGFGPKVNCTLDLCPLEMSVTAYRPSVPVNIIFIALYSFAMTIHIMLGFRWQSWFFTLCCVTCTISAIAGYVARIFMHYNPFAFYPFLIQGVFLTIVPVFYCAGIYVTLAMAVNNLAPQLKRFNPKLLVWIFLPGDMLALTLQSAGAVISAVAEVGSDLVHTGEHISIIGLALQVFSIVVFACLFVDFAVRFFRSPKGAPKFNSYDTRLRFFMAFILIALILTTARSCYRVAELYQGYTGALMKEEALFIVLEGCAIVVCVFLLTIGHPGYVFRDEQNRAFQIIDDASFSVSSGTVAKGVRLEMRKVRARASHVMTGIRASRFDDMERRLLDMEARMVTRQNSSKSYHSYQSKYAPSAYSAYSRYTDRSRPF